MAKFFKGECVDEHGKTATMYINIEHVTAIIPQGDLFMLSIMNKDIYPFRPYSVISFLEAADCPELFDELPE